MLKEEIMIPPRVSYKYGKKEDEKETFAESVIGAMLAPADNISKIVFSKK